MDAQGQLTSRTLTALSYVASLALAAEQPYFGLGSFGTDQDALTAHRTACRPSP